MQKTSTYTPLYIYLHTHWDREWFLPFNTARALLLDRVRKTLSALESGELPNFYLDGQAVVLEDLIEIEPALNDRIKNAMKRGQLSAGPWYVLPDQSLVGGESLIRNLKVGIEITRRFGQPTMTGYNPDTFCHIQDLPRILRGFDIETAVVLRGVPPLVGTNVFWWESPDGSRVLTYWLNKGLSHAVFHTTDDVQAIADDLSLRWPLDAADNTKAPMLYSCGGEGMQAPGDMINKVDKLNRILPASCKAKVVSMEEFLGDFTKWAEHKALAEISGELRDNSGINERFPAYVLDGVSSTRLYLKRANALAEQRLVRIAEPFFALLHTTAAMSYPESELAYIWKLLLQNHPHDSICGCSVDPVHQEMMTRTQQLNSFLDGLDYIAMERLSEWSPSKVGSEIEGYRKNVSALPAVTGPQAIDPDAGSNRLLLFNTSCYELRAPVWMTWYTQPDNDISSSDRLQIETNTLDTNHLFQTGGGFYYKPVRRIQGWIWPGKVPALGYREQLWNGSDSRESLDGEESIASARLLQSGDSWKIDNGLIQAQFDQYGNLVATRQISGKLHKHKIGHHFYDVGDAGDSYNFDPLPDDTPLKAHLVDIKPGKRGPLVSSVVAVYGIDIPEGLDPKTNAPEQWNERRRAKKLRRHTIQTEISVKKGVPILFFGTVFENRSRDHRLEVRFNTGQEINESWAESHFSMAKHVPVIKKTKLPVEVGHELFPESNVCQRFFIACGQIFLNRGLPEYRIERDYVGISLLRAVSWLSRGRLRTRGGGAGPWDATPEANCLGTNSCQYGWSFSGVTDEGQLGDQQIVQAYQLADLFEGRLIPFALGKFESTHGRSFIDISNPAMYVTATYVDKQKLCIRILNVTLSKQHAVIRLALPVSAAGKVNFLGERSEPLPFKRESSDSKSIELELEANELITLQFDPATAISRFTKEEA
jgi:mannosylglycerate hydrolase